MTTATTSDNTADWIIETFPVGPLQCNCTIVGNPKTKEAVVVDPGGDVDTILEKLNAHGLTVTEILHTHAHFDHFMAAGALRAKTQAPLALHKDDRFLWDNLPTQLERYGFAGPDEPIPPPDATLEHEQPFFGGTGCCLHTPGHTPGSTSFHFPDLKLLLAGDTLFKGSIGRTDLWGGDFDQIETSIRKRLYTLDDDTTVVTGHGPPTTIGDECRHNAIITA